MTRRQRLPEELHAAYGWTEAAGELDELRLLEGDELERYCRESAANNESDENCDPEVNVHTLRELHDWLVAKYGSP